MSLPLVMVPFLRASRLLGERVRFFRDVSFGILYRAVCSTVLWWEDLGVAFSLIALLSILEVPAEKRMEIIAVLVFLTASLIVATAQEVCLFKDGVSPCV